MNRRKFIGISAGAIGFAGAGFYLSSDKSNFVREDMKINPTEKIAFQPDEKEILYLSSLAPSGHNTQPWFVKYLQPYHWIICNDKTKWLSAVDPTQRETMLSLGAFIQNLEYAASNAGYESNFKPLAVTNQEENVMEVTLTKTGNTPKFDPAKIITRRTVRSNYLSDLLKTEDQKFLFQNEQDYFTFIPNGAKEFDYLNEETLNANKIQTYRDAAEKELSEWIRFSTKDAEKYCDGLTTGSMEIEGISGWVVRNFYDKEDVMKNNFRDKNIETVLQQVSQSAGWLVITSKNNSVSSLIETGKRLQRLLLKVREKGIAIHPMTQILEESATQQKVNKALGISDPVQFLLRLGYVKDYPSPVSLRRPVDWFVRT